MNKIISLDVTDKYHDVFNVTQLFSQVLNKMNTEFDMVEVDFVRDGIDKEQILNASGVLISGSKYSVNDKLAWIDEAKALVRELDETGIPVLGICFGHQLIASALGGQVVQMKTYEIGPYALQLTEKGQSDPVFKHIDSGTQFMFSHFDHVAQLPPDATTLACTDLDPHSAFKLRNMRGVQCHPELTGPLLAKVMIQYKDAFLQYIQESDSEWENRADAISQCTLSGDLLLRNFFDFLIEIESTDHRKNKLVEEN